MRKVLVTIAVFFCFVAAAMAQISIGINFSSYPQLVPVPGYPVYYAPQANANYFFYDGMYWVYQADNWYTSSWYNGPWELVSPDAVPLYVLRVPVRYYRAPPQYFRGWRADAPPRWGEHWGAGWERSHAEWDRWNRSAAPAPAPLPTYQRQFSGNRYPQADQQQALHAQHYRYQARDEEVRQRYQQPTLQGPAPSDRQQRTRGPNASAETQQFRGQPTAQGAPAAAERQQQRTPRAPAPAEPQRNQQQGRNPPAAAEHGNQRAPHAAPREQTGDGDKGDQSRKQQ